MPSWTSLTQAPCTEVPTWRDQSLITDEEELADFLRTPLDHGKMCSTSLSQADLVPKRPGMGEYHQREHEVVVLGRGAP